MKKIYINIDDITTINFHTMLNLKIFEVLNTIKVIDEAIKIKLRDFDNGSIIHSSLYIYVKNKNDIILSLSSEPSKDMMV